MDLMVNFSDAAGELVRAGEIEVDFFKTPDWEWIAAPASELRPVRVHFGVRIGAIGAWTYDRQAVRRWLERTGTRFVNVHLSPQGMEMWNFDARWCDPGSVERATARLHRDIEIYTDTFGPAGVIVENVPFWNDKPEDELMCKPGALPEVIHETVMSHGCGLLLDFAHARITAAGLGMDPREYIQRLPVHRLRECHVSGVAEVNGRLCDHVAMQPDDWDLLAWGLEHIRAGRWSTPDALTFEYGGLGKTFAPRSRRDVLREQVPRLREMLT